MKKFVSTASNIEIKVGDKVTITAIMSTPLGIIEESRRIITINKSIIEDLVKKGQVTVIQHNPDPLEILDKAIKNLSKRTNIQQDKLMSIFKALYKVNSWAVIQIVLKEVAIELDKQYDNHISKSEEIYTISKNKRISILSKDSIKSYETLPAFRTKEDAKIACDIFNMIPKQLYIYN